MRLALCNSFLQAKRIRDDEAGKAADPRKSNKFSRESGLETRVIFVEDYDSYIARRLVQGVDLWVNHPCVRWKQAAQAE